MNRSPISQKAARFTESVILGMSIETRKHGAINLAQGMPDFPAPAAIKAAACRAIEDDIDFARYLVRDLGVATVPGSSFFQDKALGRPYVRFCFCKCDETLDEAAQRLRGLRVMV